MGRKREHKTVSVVLKVILCIILAGTALFGGVLAMVCVQEGKTPKELNSDMEYDAVIILGAQVKPDGTPSVQLTWRLDAAKDAWDMRNVPIVVCGAQGRDEPMTEADAMEIYLSARGVPGDMILKDPDSFNTVQNLKTAKRLLDDYPEVRNVLIVTSDYHVPRSLAIAGDLGYAATGLGSPCLPDYWIKNHARETLAWCKYWAVKYLHLPLD